MKFSIIVPVYNVSLYIEKCLNSLKRQKGNSFEVLVINDGSRDNSLEIIEKCVGKDDRFKVYTKENGDISDARNYGINRAQGEYLLFVDGDDFVEEDYLEVIEQNLRLHHHPDILRYQVFRHHYESERSELCQGSCFSLTGVEAFRKLIYETYFDVVWAYAFKRSFFEQYHFRFEKGRRHEDFGLIPYVILKAKEVVSIEEGLYYYVERDHSITTSLDYEKIKKRLDDALYLYDMLMKKVAEDSFIQEDDKAFVYSYLANAMLGMGKDLEKNLLKSYVREVKLRNISSYLLDDSIGRKLKKMISTYFTTFYIKHFAK